MPVSVSRGPDGVSSLAAPPDFLQRVGDAEVRQDRLAGGREHDVLGLEIPMDDPVGVGVSQRRGDLERELNRRPGLQPPKPPEPIAERSRLDVGHGVEQPACGAAGIEQRQDVGVLEAGLGPDLALEALHAEGGAQGGVQNLERHAAPVAEVLGQVDGRAAAPAQLLLDQVVLGELRREEVLAFGGRCRI